MLKHWGFDKLAQEGVRGVDRRDEARRQADRAHPDARRPAQPAGPGQAADRRGRTRRCCECDLELERGAQATVKDGIAHCEAVRDYVSRDLLKRSSTTPRSTSTSSRPRLDLVDKVGHAELPAIADGRIELKRSADAHRPPALAPQHLEPLALESLTASSGVISANCNAVRISGSSSGSGRRAARRAARAPCRGSCRYSAKIALTVTCCSGLPSSSRSR